MQNFVITGKAKNVFRTIKLMAQAEKAAEKEEKKWGKAPKNPSLN
ncbi:hypothetical protein ACFLSK_02120 [Chloroflexota bacterium]